MLKLFQSSGATKLKFNFSLEQDHSKFDAREYNIQSFVSPSLFHCIKEDFHPN